MEGLMKNLPPLAPDYSGANSALFTLGGAIIINGADGCIGNVTGYDEPRFFDYSTHIYSSGLREVKAITGDEEILQEKIENSVGDKPVNFIVILGTPNSAVIASDHNGVSNILRKGRRIPVFTINTTGINTYETGAADAFYQLATWFVKPVEKTGGVNIIGATPLDYWDYRQISAIRESLEDHGLSVNGIWGMDDSLESIEQTLAADVNLVVSYSGLKAARYLMREFGMPYVAGVPVGRRQTQRLVDQLRGGKREADHRLELSAEEESSGTRVLVIGDQIWTDSVRNYYLLERKISRVFTASFFSLDKELKKETDYFISSERALSDLIVSLAPDIMIADPLCRPFIRNNTKSRSVHFVDVPHLAVSSRIHWNHAVIYVGEDIDFL